MKQKEFSCHLTALTPDLKRLIKAVRRTRYFGIYDESDLLQETMLSLYVKVPRSYKENKGRYKVKGHGKKCKCEKCIAARAKNVKKYCLQAARNLLKRIAHREHKHTAETSVDFLTLGRFHDDESMTAMDKYVRHEALEKSAIESERDSVIFKVKLDSLAKRDKDVCIVKTALKHDMDRKSVCKELKISNAHVTKVFKRVRRYRNVFTTCTSTPNTEIVKMSVNEMAATGV